METKNKTKKTKQKQKTSSNPHSITRPHHQQNKKAKYKKTNTKNTKQKGFVRSGKLEYFFWCFVWVDWWTSLLQQKTKRPIKTSLAPISIAWTFFETQTDSSFYEIKQKQNNNNKIKSKRATRPNQNVRSDGDYDDKCPIPQSPKRDGQIHFTRSIWVVRSLGCYWWSGFW